MTPSLADMIAHLDGRQWIPTLDLGRRLAASSANGQRQAVFDETLGALREELLPLVTRGSWRMTIFCGLEILESDEFVEALKTQSCFEIGIRIFAEDSDAHNETRAQRISKRVQAYRRAFGCPPRAFRAEPSDFDSELGLELMAEGLEIDSTARPDRMQPHSLPAGPWRCQAGDGDLLRPGFGEVTEIPVLQLMGADLDLELPAEAKPWDLGHENAERDLPRFIETLEEVTKRVKQRIPVVTTFEVECLADSSHWRIMSFLESLGATLASRGCLSSTATEVDLSRMMGTPAARPPRAASPGSYQGVAPGQGKLSFCVITDGKRPEKLRRLVSSIEAQGIPDFEVIVAGRPPSDLNIQAVFASQAADGGRLGPLRNASVSAATGDWLVIFDDDFLLVENWYETLKTIAPKVDLLSAEVRLPDGSRFWDHATVDGPRGHLILDANEQDAFRYVTGGGGWLMSRRAAKAVQWSEELAFNEGEDVDLSRRLQNLGFAIQSVSGLVSIHADERYTSMGRRTLARTLKPSARWVELELSEHTPRELVAITANLLSNSNLAEAADVARYAVSRFPEERALHRMQRFLICSGGGELPGSRFSPQGDPLWLATLDFLARRDLRALVSEAKEY